MLSLAGGEFSFDIPGPARNPAPRATVDVIADNRVIFDLAGNRDRLVAHVSCPFRRVLVKFIGTHGKYDRIDPESIG